MQKFLYYIISIALIVPSGAFAASDIPSVQSNNAKNITYNSADIYGSISPGTADDNVYWFEWGPIGADDVSSFKTYQRNIGNRSGRKEVYSNLRGLAPNTQYYFRLNAENQKGQVTGNTIYFTTKNLEDKGEAVVIAQTRNVINVREETATVYGYIAPHNSSARYWFEFGTDSKMDMTSATRSIGRDGGEVNVDLKSLVPGTTYYYRVAGENNKGVVFGDTKSFHTKGTKPVNDPKVTTQAQKVSTKKKDVEKADNGGFLSSIFGGTSKKTDDSSKTTKKTTKSSDSDSTVSGEDMTGSIGNANKDVKVTVKSVMKDNTVEYKVSYKYNKKDAGSNAELQVTIPKTVAYAGDTTSDELRVQEGKNANIYVLPIGSIKKGDTRTITIVGILTSDAKNIPKASAKLVFDTKSGSMYADSNMASVGGASSGTPLSFPSGLITWFVVLNLIVIALILGHKAMENFALAKAKADEENTQKEETLKEIKETLIADEKREEVVPHFNPEVLNHVSPNNNPIPVKPKIADEMKSSSISEVGLPGMEVI